LNWAVGWVWILTTSSVLCLVNGRRRNVLKTGLPRAVPLWFVLLLIFVGSFIIKVVFFFQKKVIFHFQIFWGHLPFSRCLRSSSIFNFFEVVFHFQIFWCHVLLKKTSKIMSYFKQSTLFKIIYHNSKSFFHFLRHLFLDAHSIPILCSPIVYSLCDPLLYWFIHTRPDMRDLIWPIFFLLLLVGSK